MSPLAGKGTWCSLSTTPSMLPTATKHFDRAGNGTSKFNLNEEFIACRDLLTDSQQ